MTPSEITFYGWLESESIGEARPQDTTDAIVIRTDAGPPAILRHFRLGTLDVAHLTGGAVDLEPMLTARRWRGVVVGYLVAGELTIEQGGGSLTLGPGDLAIYTAAQRYRITCPGHHEFLVVRIPTASIALRHDAFADVVATDLSGLVSTSVLRGMLAALAGSEAAPTLSAGAHLGDAIVSAAHAVIADARPPGTAGAMSLFTTMATWIEDHLEDPDLSAETVARAHFLSARYVRRVFAANGVTVTALIRQRRLERIRDELVDPRRVREQVSAIAERWGFPDPPAVSRAFRRQFGVSPRRYRELHLRQGQPASLPMADPEPVDPDLEPAEAPVQEDRP